MRNKKPRYWNIGLSRFWRESNIRFHTRQSSGKTGDVARKTRASEISAALAGLHIGSGRGSKSYQIARIFLFTEEKSKQVRSKQNACENED